MPNHETGSSSAADSWYARLERLGEWLLVGAVASLGLAAVPGIVSLLFLLWFFVARPQNQPHPQIRRHDELEHKRHRTAEEQTELKAMEDEFHAAGSLRKAIPGWAGFSFWVAAILYLGIVRGMIQKVWF